MTDFELVLLAGGKSSRMERSKLFLEMDGRVVLAHWLEKLGGAFPTRIVLAADGGLPEQVRVDAISFDQVANAGPLAGIESAMRDSKAQWLIVATIDMPMIGLGQFDRLIEFTKQNPDSRGAMFRRESDGEELIEPFPCILHRSLASEISSRVAEGRRSVHGLAADKWVSLIDSNEPEETWLNMNTPADFERFRERVMKSGWK